MIAALFVAENGIYFGLPNVNPWGPSRDAKTYRGPGPAIAHPPCDRWGRYWGGGPSAKVTRLLGDDDGCFYSALVSVRRYGGLIEHPAHSYAWDWFGLPRPDRAGGWTSKDRFGGRSCHVEQGHYGHPARKATWLYLVAKLDPPELIWGPSTGRRLDEGFHSTEERRRARAAGVKPTKRLTSKECEYTPAPFRDLLISLILTTTTPESAKEK